MRNKILLATLPTTTELKFIELEVYYSLGGTNWFSGRTEKRGYWASATPVTIENSGGFACRRITIGGSDSGIKTFIEEAGRFNQRRLEALRADAVPHVGRVLRSVLSRSGLTLTPEGEKLAAPFLTAGEPGEPVPGHAPERLPDTINAIIQQMGGRGITGAFVYVGAGRIVHKCPRQEGECRSGYRSRVTPEGLIDYDVGIQFTVNGKPGELWKMVVAYEPDDSYSVWLWTNKSSVPGKMGEVIEHREDIYCDNLKQCVEAMYDRAIQARNQGFIPLGAA